MNEKNIGFWNSWPVIIIALCCFWPVGLILFFKRVSKDKKTAIGAAKGLKAVGVGLIVFGSVGFIGCISDGGSGSGGGAFIAILFIIGGIVLTKRAKKMRRKAENIKQYLSIIVNGNVRQLDVIAHTVGKQYDVVKKDVQMMIDTGFLKNAYINEGTREVVLTGEMAGVLHTMDPANMSGNEQVIQTRIVVCPCCGANNKVYGVTGECEYCGSPLK